MKKILVLMLVIVALICALASCGGQEQQTTPTNTANSTTTTTQPIVDEPPMHEHSYNAEVTPPTCKEKGYTTYTCDCDDSYVDDYVDSLGHTESDWIVDVEVTTTTEGSKHTECTVCGETIKTEVIEKSPKPASEGLEFELNEDGQSYYVKGIGTCKDTDIVIPSTYNDLLVTSIGENAFSGCTTMVSIEIPDSITSVGKGAFDDCTSLKDVYYTGDVEGWLGITFYTVAIYVPYSCSNPMKYAENLYFNNEIVTEIVIPDSVTSIGKGAFYYFKSLTNIDIPDSVTSIGDSAFAFCTSLTSVKIPDSVTNIASDAFYWCGSLIEVINKSSLNIVAGSYDYGYVGDYAKYIITDESQSALKTVGDYIFYDDGTDIYLVKYLGSDAEITLPAYDGGKEYGVWNYAFYDNDIITSITIPDSVTSIGYCAFYNCSSLTSINIPASVTSIGSSAFSRCSSLTSIVIPDSVTSIGSYVFYGCSSLTSISIPDSVTNIGYLAFYGCSSLTSITIPDSVTSIGNYAFDGCSSLTIYCEATSKPSGWSSYWNPYNYPVVWGYKPE